MQNLLFHYIRRIHSQSQKLKKGEIKAESTPKFSGGSQSPVVVVLQLIFNLTLAECKQWYKLKAASDLVKETLMDLHRIGLITMKKPSDPMSKFCVSSLLKSFLDKSIATAAHQFIIVESNFKVYAYTDSRLYQAILRLFIREDYRFPNLVVGMLTRESLNDAFRKKITAQ